MRKGLFNGQMMHLREFEKTFGPGTLRVMAEYYDSSEDVTEDMDFFQMDDVRDQKYQNFINYFRADADMRPFIAKGLLRKD